MCLMTFPVLFILTAVGASIEILDSSFRLNGEPQSVTPELTNENNPGHDFLLGAESTPIAYNDINAAPEPCIGSTGDFQPIGKLRARRDSDQLNIENSDQIHGKRKTQPVARDTQCDTGHESGNGNGNNGNNGNGKHQESNQQNELNSTPLPGNGAGNNDVPPKLPVGNDPLDECKGYFDVFEYVICDSGKSMISPLRDMMRFAHHLLPNQMTFMLSHCTQGNVFLLFRPEPTRGFCKFELNRILRVSDTSVQCLPLGKRCMVLRGI